MDDFCASLEKKRIMIPRNKVLRFLTVMALMALVGCMNKVDNLPGSPTNSPKNGENEEQTEERMAVVTVNNLRYRTGPSLNASVGGRLPYNTVVELTGDKLIANDSISVSGEKTLDFWYEFTRDNETYWVYGGGLRLIKDVEELPDSTLISPGVFVGIISAKDDESSLNLKFGSENVNRVEIEMGEGIKAQGNVIFPDSEKEIFVLWKENNFTDLFAVELVGDKSVYKTAEGLSLGTDIADVQKMNKGQFTILGFGNSDLSGKLNSWEKGHFTKDLLVYFTPTTDQYAEEIKGDEVLSSNDYKFQYAKPVVSKMRIYLTR